MNQPAHPNQPAVPRWAKWLALGFLFAGVLVWRFTRQIDSYGISDAFRAPLVEAVPAGLNSLKASECGICHTEIYAEWQTTIHANAWTEDYFQLDWKHDGEKQNCRNCHTPFADQQPQRVTGFVNDDPWQPILVPNPTFDPDFQAEAVTCASCHVRDGQVIGPYETDLAPHPVKVDPSMRNGMGPCEMCHITAAANEVTVGDMTLCSMVDEIEEGGRVPNCIDCHMPKVERSVVEGGPIRSGRRHYWRGGHDPNQVRKALKIEVMPADDGVDVVLTNVGTHHNFPTGTPDRHLVMTATVTDAEGQRIAEREETLIRRILWRPVIYEVSDARLPFMSPRSFPISATGSKPYTVEVVVTYGFLEAWRRNQLGLPEDSHQSYEVGRQVVVIP